MIKKIGIILLAVVFLGSMAWTPVFNSAQADVKAAQCGCGKDCQCDHCKTGKGECSCKVGAKGCACGKDCKCDHCKTGKGECSCKAGAKGCACKVDGKGGCQCGKDCKCGHCGADQKGMKGTHSRHGKGCSCGTDGKGGCQCGKDCKCGHCGAGAAAAADDVKAPTADADYARTMTSKSGIFKASYTSEADTLPVNKIVSLNLKVETADNKPVKDAEITAAGDMPEHGHGMPTQPKVTKNNNDGTYVVEGIKFSMTGWWTVTFTIKAGGKTDTVTFNLRLK